MSNMEHLIITIRPAQSDNELLRVSDAMQQVIDSLKLLAEAERAISSPEKSFEWRLERASTASPFTIVARAEAIHPHVDVSEQVRKVKAEFSSGIRKLIQIRELPWWMGPDAVNLARSVFARTQNGIGNTEIEIAPNDKLFIDRKEAAAGIEAIDGINIASVQDDLNDRIAWGEIEGVIVAAGRYQNCPAIQIRNEQYGFIWCQLSKALIKEFGDEHRMSDIWSGKSLGVEGRLIYGKAGKLSRIGVIGIREMESVPRIDLDSVLDPDFTSGLDPVEYLQKLHDGEIA